MVSETDYSSQLRIAYGIVGKTVNRECKSSNKGSDRRNAACFQIHKEEASNSGWVKEGF